MLNTNYHICASQAFVNIVLTLCDPGDSVVMFAPYYFNAYMSFQMTGVTDILVGPSDPKTLHPDVGKLLADLLVTNGLWVLHVLMMITFFRHFSYISW